jgi:hypothetical protein
LPYKYEGFKIKTQDARVYPTSALQGEVAKAKSKSTKPNLLLVALDEYK